MDAKTIEELFTKQKQLAKWIRNFIENTNKSKAAQELTLADFQTHLQLLESYWKQFSANHFCLAGEEEKLKTLSYFKDELFDLTTENYLLTKATLQRSITALEPAPPAPALLTTSTPTLLMQSSLERVKLPRFSGKRRDWQHFSKRFTALVINDRTLMPVIKLQHLITSLDGEVADSLRSIEDFETAWASLNKRFDDKLVRFNAQMESLIGLPSAATESVQHLTTLLNTVSESISVFRALTCPYEHWDNMLVYFIESKLAPATRLDWEKEREAEEQANDFATYAEMKKFLEARVRSLDRVEKQTSFEAPPGAERSRQGTALATPSKGNSKKGATPHNQSVKNTTSFAAVATPSKPNKTKSASKCVYCKEAHFIGYCQPFADLAVSERPAFVSSAQLCFNCLGSQHRADTCNSRHRCLVCKAKHHTKLHLEGGGNITVQERMRSTGQNGGSSSKPTSTTQSSTSPLTSSTHAALGDNSKILSTAVVILQADSGATYTARALLDSGSEESYVSEHVVQALNLPLYDTYVVVHGLGESTSIIRSWTSLTPKSSIDRKFGLQFKALTLDRLTSSIPSVPGDLPAWKHLHGLELADPHQHTTGRIDCLLGAEVFAAVLRPGLVSGPPGAPVAIATVFGCVILGGARPCPNSKKSPSAVYHISDDRELTDALSRFWEIEEPPTVKLNTPAEEQCLAHFRETVERDQTGRFVVHLPFREKPRLANMHGVATACLRCMENKFAKDSTLHQAYAQFMREYKTLGHMQPVPEEEIDRTEVNYLPHHAVLEGGDYEKIRVVFNAAVKDATGASFNDFLHPGPNLLRDIRVILILWRFFPWVFHLRYKKNVPPVLDTRFRSRLAPGGVARPTRR